jgi:hypothetical protein
MPPSRSSCSTGQRPRSVAIPCGICGQGRQRPRPPPCLLSSSDNHRGITTEG